MYLGQDADIPLGACLVVINVTILWYAMWMRYSKDVDNSIKTISTSIGESVFLQRFGVSSKKASCDIGVVSNAMHTSTGSGQENDDIELVIVKN